MLCKVIRSDSSCSTASTSILIIGKLDSLYNVIENSIDFQKTAISWSDSSCWNSLFALPAERERGEEKEKERERKKEKEREREREREREGKKEIERER